MKSKISKLASATFAVPTQFVTPTAGTGALRTLLALVLVLIVVFAAASLLRRLRAMSATGTAHLQVMAQVSLGARERAVLIRVGTQQFLVGVGPGSVQLLSALAASPEESPPATPKFRDLLRRSLGR